MTLDDVTLFSKRHLLTGRPDRIVKHGKFFIPEEWKSSKKVEPWHLVQLGVYFILIEDHYGKRPPYGFIVLSGGRRERVMNTPIEGAGALGGGRNSRTPRATRRRDLRIARP